MYILVGAPATGSSLSGRDFSGIHVLQGTSSSSSSSAAGSRGMRDDLAMIRDTLLLKVNGVLFHLFRSLQ